MTRANQFDRPVLPLIQYWHEEQIPAEIEPLLTLTREQNPERSHMLFNEKTATNFIETHFGDREVAAFRACAVPAMQADFFRYCAVYVLGGMYSDADNRCLRSLMCVPDGDGELFELVHDAGIVANHLFAFKTPRHPLLELTIDIATKGIESRYSESVPTVTGPVIFTSLTMIWRLGLDPFVDLVKDWYFPFSVKPEIWLRHVELICEVVGSHARIAVAFDGVRVSPVDKLRSLITWDGSRLSYKKTDVHYPRWNRSIYR